MRLPLPSAARKRLRRPAAVLTALAAASALLFAGAAPASAATAQLPVRYSPLGGLLPSLTDPSSAPPGANDWNCRPGSAHPRPVVLVNGTFANMRNNWDSLSPLLHNRGYCVYAFNYGGLAGNVIQSIGDIPTSAGQLSAFVDRVLAATGSSQVDLVGHSQGGLLPRYYLNFLGGAPKVHSLVGLAPSNHGTTLDGLVTLASAVNLLGLVNPLVSAACTACIQQEVGSDFVRRMNAVPDTVPGVDYTVISTAYDAVVTPYRSTFLAGSRVTNITLQDQCGWDFSGHVGIAFSPNALGAVLNALDPAHAAAVPCTLYVPGL
ncbi:esterase/lipase family protein [Peterkaempfera bronchialis]|uniref:esterase/lipase family protein n=1 Tax=Peterkaempfera bronchialis TaxID=2126346 RepID=UPI003C2FFFA5